MIKTVFVYTTILALLACNSCKTDSKQESFDRVIPLEGQDNFRDVGNYLTTNGETLKKGRVYRSGTLSKVTEQDMTIIEDLGIKTVINFLTKEEIAKRGADKLPDGVKSIYLPISGDNGEASAVLQARQTGNFAEVPISLNYNIHKLLPEVGKDSYYQLFKTLADASNYPVVFHCSHGVHRTGTATALLLSLVGVSWTTIENDYLLSNECRQHENQSRIYQLDSIAKQNFVDLDFAQNKENIEAFYILQKEYILGTKVHIEETYGSFEKYFESLGLTEEDILAIKKNLLQE